jgi:hypothetical protein
MEVVIGNDCRQELDRWMGRTCSWTEEDERRWRRQAMSATRLSEPWQKIEEVVMAAIYIEPLTKFHRHSIGQPFPVSGQCFFLAIWNRLKVVINVLRMVRNDEQSTSVAGWSHMMKVTPPINFLASTLYRYSTLLGFFNFLYRLKVIQLDCATARYDCICPHYCIWGSLRANLNPGRFQTQIFLWHHVFLAAMLVLTYRLTLCCDQSGLS